MWVDRSRQNEQVHFRTRQSAGGSAFRDVAVGGTVILLRTPLFLTRNSIGMERACQQYDSLADS